MTAALSSGRAIMTTQELGALLKPGEAMLAFRIGDEFSVASMTIRHGAQTTSVTIPLPRATSDSVEAEVSAILHAIEAREPGARVPSRSDESGTHLGIGGLRLGCSQDGRRKIVHRAWKTSVHPATPAALPTRRNSTRCVAWDPAVVFGSV